MVAGVVWSRINRPFEGPVLLVVTPTHGLTVADLPSVAAFIVAVVLLLPKRSGRP